MTGTKKDSWGFSQNLAAAKSAVSTLAIRGARTVVKTKEE